MKETDMDEMTTQPLEQLVRRVRSQDLSRGRFIALLTGLGASATGIATLLASAETAGAAGRPTPPAHPHTAAQRHNTHLHETHVRRQGALTHGAAPAPEGGLSADHTQRLQAIVEDYAPDAVVEDPLFADPIVGKEAIAARKLAEMQGMRGVTIDVTHRFAHHNQVVAEWVLRGRHEGAIFGYPATGRQIEVRGVTVVTREDGKITRESLHYDAADVHRQLSA